jgi:hypothetical protein
VAKQLGIGASNMVLAKCLDKAFRRSSQATGQPGFGTLGVACNFIVTMGRIWGRLETPLLCCGKSENVAQTKLSRENMFHDVDSRFLLTELGILLQNAYMLQTKLYLPFFIE